MDPQPFASGGRRRRWRPGGASLGLGRGGPPLSADPAKGYGGRYDDHDEGNYRDPNDDCEYGDHDDDRGFRARGFTSASLRSNVIEGETNILYHSPPSRQLPKFRVANVAHGFLVIGGTHTRVRGEREEGRASQRGERTAVLRDKLQRLHTSAPAVPRSAPKEPEA
ncbi:hypothetical protein OsI_12763 [Oryza sativa Indica Group]|uniref:Uncharacterized protein n=1 Tax=Oryza sativa subsp. indica TaxID=39946 RepID=B8AN42_ORYSI|nr:hypothetical protein OsI_12763 [Oryza sativa Indica Group]